jgi:hypothetical protein
LHASKATGILREAFRGPRGLRRVAYGGLALVGFILSPFTWWNDAFVNIPLSLAAGAAASRLLEVPLDVAVAGAYLASNALGILLMYVGGAGALGGRVRRRDLAVGLAFSAAYTAAVLLIL